MLILLLADTIFVGSVRLVIDTWGRAIGYAYLATMVVAYVYLCRSRPFEVDQGSGEAHGSGV